MVIPYELSPTVDIYYHTGSRKEESKMEAGEESVPRQLQDADCSFPAETCSCLYDAAQSHSYVNIAILYSGDSQYFILFSGPTLI